MTIIHKLTLQVSRTIKENTDRPNSLELIKKIDDITKDASKPYFNNILKNLVKNSTENTEIICNYIIAEISEINLKKSTKEGKIKILVWLSNHFENKLSFRKMRRQDILDFLSSLRKSSEIDPSQKWINTYNGRQMILLKFFKWLHNPDESDQRNRITPPCMQGIKKLPKREKTPYKPSDIWDVHEHSLFLKYCPDKRDRCYHALANDMSARPHEILNLKIKDITFQVTENGIQYAEVRINDGKTGPRTVPLIDSIPYLKEWILEHPTNTNPNAWLFLSKSKNSLGEKLTYDGLVSRYSYYYKATYFPNLSKEETVPESDKSLIRYLLTKPWNLYIFRHSALTEKSQYLSDSALKDHAGWSMGSKMTQVYVHLRGESSRLLLQQKGLIRKEDEENSKILKCKQCPNCSEPNKTDSKFCIKCKMVLSYTSYTEVLTNQKEKDLRIIKMENQLNTVQNQIQSLMSCIDNICNQSEINSFANKLYSAGIINVK